MYEEILILDLIKNCKTKAKKPKEKHHIYSDAIMPSETRINELLHFY